MVRARIGYDENVHDVKQRTRLSFWPSPQDYNEAIQNAHANFGDAELRAAQVHTDKLGLPRPMTGAFASVYRMTAPTRDLAVRCFLRDIADQEQRYRMISDFVEHDDLPYTVGFEFLREGIRVNNHWFPSLKMDFVDGLPLDAFVRQHGKEPKVMAILAGKFVKMVDDLARNGIAHGDLQHGNILVIPNNELRLVDYDGMFVPGMEGMLSNEIGHPNYQHPHRAANDFGPYLDNFSAWVIYASLKSLSIDPLLFNSLSVGDDCLLFRRDDFVQPDYSHAFALLEANPNNEIVHLARCVRWQLSQAPSAVAPLTARVPELGPLPKVQIAPGSAVPDWIKFAAVSDLKSNSRRKAAAAATAYAPPAPAVPQKLPTGLVLTPPPLLRKGPRQLRWRANSEWLDPVGSQWLMLLNPMLWVILGFLVSVIPADQNVIIRGADTTGTVQSTEYVEGKGSHWNANYAYQALDGTHYGSARYYDEGQLHEGNQRPVRYDKLEPSHHVFDTDYVGTVNAARAKVNEDWSIVVALALMTVVLEVLWWYKPLQQRRIVGKGKATRGKITRKFTQKGNKGAVYHYLEFSFNSSAGPASGKQQVPFYKYHSYEEQQTVVVVYEESNPSSCLVYELGWYEAL